MALDLKSLAVPRMLAQRVMPRLDGLKLQDKDYLKDVLRLIDAGVGGFILFGGDFWEVRQALPKLQARAKIPLLIASDMEKGAGQQLKGATVFPCQMAVAAATDLVSGDGLGLISEMLEGVSEEARGAGVHAVLAPVLDVNSNPHNPIICTRAFSDEPKAVSALGEQYVKGLQGSPLPVMACGKHFPGHGEAGLDSHSALPAIDKDRDSLEEEDMLPFRRAAMAGIEMMMTAHLKVPALDPAYPASLSQLITRGYLRNRSRFEGIILTDALSMSALTAHYSVRDAARLAIKAGADILLHPADPFVLLDALSDLARTKEVTKEDAMASASRLQRAKAKYCLGAKLTDRQMAERLAKNAETAQAIARRALTLVKAAGAFPALKDVKGGVAHVVLEDDNDPKAGRALRSALARHKNVRNFFVTRKKAAVMRQEVMSGTRGAALTIISIFSKVSAGKGTSGLSQELMELGRQLVVKGKKKAVVSFGSPYILKNFMDAEYVVAAYDPGEAMQGAAYRAFLGEIVFMGELPVRI
ncbi:MAG TPA: glycoside hydrolase family 3 N-terminal domain-containing protein [Nitrospirota bacterium]|nr:glycoside hydrolase family 3 N-terminal domain-containing protein [Nitrospirota bacterium]